MLHGIDAGVGYSRRMGGGHAHTEGQAFQTPRRLERIVVWVLVPLVALVALGAAWYWPSGSSIPTIAVGDFVSGTVQELQGCPEDPTGTCAVATIRVDEGPDTGLMVEVNITLGSSTPDLSPGTDVLLAALPDSDPPYALADVDRTTPLLVLSAMFAVAVVLLARWKGLLALAGLAASMLILGLFVLPSLLGGNPPVMVAAVGASAIAIVSMGLAHGFSVRTGVALIGTLIALLLTTLLGEAATQAMNFTGLTSEDAAYLHGVTDGAIDLRGLLLAGLVIGALGVLDDVTVTQAAAVWEVFGADQRVSLRSLWASGMRVGRDHVAAVVNTLVLAYVGASLPLFLLITLSDAPLMQSINNEVIAAEVVRSLVGCLGIVAAVPITTWLAALLLAQGRRPDDARGSPGAR